MKEINPILPWSSLNLQWTKERTSSWTFESCKYMRTPAQILVSVLLALTWGTIYGQVFSVSFRVSRLQGLQPSGELGTSCTVREIVETLKWKLFHSRLDIIFSIPRAILEWSSLLNIEAPCIKEIRLQTNGEFGELQSLFACSQVKFTSALHDLCHG